MMNYCRSIEQYTLYILQSFIIFQLKYYYLFDKKVVEFKSTIKIKIKLKMFTIQIHSLLSCAIHKIFV